MAAAGAPNLERVEVTQDVFLGCLHHAVSTEHEEVMGLLLGDIQHGVAQVWASSQQRRVDRRPDRVEISPEQLADATAEAELLSKQIMRKTRVVGWYHSHPHITVLPSHVDCRTQGSFQLFDRGFVGLIISAFSDQADCSGRVQAVAFQATSEVASPPTQQLVQLKFVQTPSFGERATSKVAALQHVAAAEEKEAYLTALELTQRKREERGGDSAVLGGGGGADLFLAEAHHTALYVKAMCGLLNTSVAPLVSSLRDTKQRRMDQIALLREEIKKLSTVS